jgi:hypothetical protein
LSFNYFDLDIIGKVIFIVIITIAVTIAAIKIKFTRNLNFELSMKIGGAILRLFLDSSLKKGLIIFTFIVIFVSALALL